jgi:Ni,Fe-hydrogenase III component G
MNYEKLQFEREIIDVTSIQKLINIDRRKLVEILVLILKK